MGRSGLAGVAILETSDGDTDKKVHVWESYPGDDPKLNGVIYPPLG